MLDDATKETGNTPGVVGFLRMQAKKKGPLGIWQRVQLFYLGRVSI